MKLRKYKVSFVEVTPNWHHPELYENMSKHDRLDLQMYFCSSEALNGELLSDAFAVKNADWGVDLLRGYKHKFLKNYSFIPPAFMKTRVCSYLNFGIWSELRKNNFDAVVITMWNDVTFWLAAFVCKLMNCPFLLSGDSTTLTEKGHATWLRKIKSVLLGKILFRMASGFLYRGELNKQFYKDYAVPDEKLFFYPLSVDYEKFSRLHRSLLDKKKQLRRERGIPLEAYVILFAGRFAIEKRPADLIQAFGMVAADAKMLLMVGDGHLRDSLETQVKVDQVNDVRFTGFLPRSEVLNYYALADVFVLPSGHEPQGDVVKEAMCFGIPCVVSDKVGASADIIRHDENGYVFHCGDTTELAQRIDELSCEKKRTLFRSKSLETISKWDHNAAINGLVSALDNIYQE